jgi:hypothetical protein
MGPHLSDAKAATHVLDNGADLDKMQERWGM